MKKKLNEAIVQEVAAEMPGFGEQIKTEQSQADVMLEKADAQGLHLLWQHSVADRAKLLETLAVILTHYGEKGKERQQPNDRAMDAMERLATATVELAKKVLDQNGTH